VPLCLNHHVQRYRSYHAPRKVSRLRFFNQVLPVYFIHSGTSGYVIRNLSTLRVHERNDKSAWDTAPPKHREPDEAILEHERKRKVEIKCLELQLELEDKEYVYVCSVICQH